MCVCMCYRQQLAADGCNKTIGIISCWPGKYARPVFAKDLTTMQTGTIERGKVGERRRGGGAGKGEKEGGQRNNFAQK